MSLIDKIIGADDLKTKTIEVKEWGVSITLKEMSGFHRAEFEKKVSKLNDSKDPKDSVRMMALIIVMTAIGESGKPAFTDKDIDSLAEKNFSILNRLSTEALQLSEMTDGDIEELAGNSSSDQSGDSISD